MSNATTTTKQESRRAYVERQAAKARKKYKRACRRLLEAVIWDDPTFDMGVILTNRRVPEDFAADLRKCVSDVQETWDAWTEWTCQIDGHIPTS